MTILSETTKKVLTFLKPFAGDSNIPEFVQAKTALDRYNTYLGVLASYSAEQPHKASEFSPDQKVVDTLKENVSKAHNALISLENNNSLNDKSLLKLAELKSKCEKITPKDDDLRSSTTSIKSNSSSASNS